MPQIWIVDAFTDTPYRGNPAAVMPVEEFPADAVCQAIAAEMNLSETAFLKPLGAGRYRLRWFTPKTEIKLCGHATLASAHILFAELNAVAESVTFETLSGPLQVRREGAFYAMDFPLQATGAAVDPAVFGPLFTSDTPIVAVVQAYDDVLVEIGNAAALRRFTPDIERIARLDCRGLIVTAAGDAPHDFTSRFFAPRVGIAEDPVTGSAHCKLAHYWSRKLGKAELLAYQASARGGTVALTVRDDRVLLKGRAVTIMAGQWRVGLSAGLERAA